MAALSVGRLLLAASSFFVVLAQQRGNFQEEMGVPMPSAWCTKQKGCCAENSHVTLDANWRWLHLKGNSVNCFLDGKWVQKYCSKEDDCAHRCAVEGLSSHDYKTKYGIQKIYHGLNMTFVTKHEYGINYGSRVYLTDNTLEKYKIFKLKNREFQFTVDSSKLPCGLNGAAYFVEMPAAGGKSALNKAGAKYGTGYCDAQCPNDIKFSEKGPNVKHRWGMCCPEVDLWEANSMSTSFTMHPCTGGNVMCLGDASCGYGSHRQSGHCDKDGCDWNPFRLGKRFYYGHHRTLDSTKPVTVITQFITKDGTDHGDLSEVRRLYVQNGKVIKNERAVNVDKNADSITDAFCTKMKTEFQDPQTFRVKGGLAELGKAMDRGMVLVLSIWDDEQTGMMWLDGKATGNKKGAARGNCPLISSQTLRTHDGSSSVMFKNIKYGHIDSTRKGGLGIPRAPCTPQHYNQPVPPVRSVLDALNFTQEYAAAEAVEVVDTAVGSSSNWLRRPLSFAGLAGVASIAMAALGMRVWQSSKRSNRNAREVEAAAEQAADEQLLVQ